MIGSERGGKGVRRSFLQGRFAMLILLGSQNRSSLYRCGLAVGLLVLLAGGAVWGYRRFEARQHWQAARQALAVQNVERARSHLDACVRYWPNDPVVRFWAARAARQAGDYEQAEEHLTACETLPPAPPSEDVDPELERLLLRAQLGDTKGLARVADGLEQSRPAWFVLALEATARGQFATMHYGEATRLVEALLQLSPAQVQGLLLRAAIYRENENEEKSIECCRMALAKAPDAVEPRLRIAESFLKMGQHREAIQLYETLRQQHPHQPEVLYRLALCRVDAQQIDEAEQLLDQLLAHRSNHVEGLVAKARLALRREHPEEAEEYLRRALQAAPTHTEASDALISCLEARGQQSEAEKCRAQRQQWEAEYGRVARWKLEAEQDSGNLKLLQSIADDLMRLGRGEEALPWYFTILQLKPNRADVHRTLAEYFAQTGQPYRAARHRRQAERTDHE